VCAEVLVVLQSLDCPLPTEVALASPVFACPLQDSNLLLTQVRKGRLSKGLVCVNETHPSLDHSASTTSPCGSVSVPTASVFEALAAAFSARAVLLAATRVFFASHQAMPSSGLTYQS
jgi:hypothetical protein